MYDAIQKPTATLLILLLALFALLTPSPVNAASFEFSATTKAAFDKMKSSADKTTAAKLTSQYTELQTAQDDDIAWDKKINELHYKNEEALLSVKNKMKEIDAAKLARLEADIIQTKKKYESLFELYESSKQQLSLAKKLKNKTLISALNTKLDITKAAVKVAKADIQSKETALKTAKSTAAKKKKQVQETLSGVDSAKIKIKAAKSSISSTKKQFQKEGTLLNQAVRKGEATASLSSLTRMLTYMKQIAGQKQSMYKHEQQITSIIAKATSQLAAAP